MNPPGPGVPRGVTEIRFPSGLSLMRVVTLASGGLEYGKPWRPVFGWAVGKPMVCAGIDPANSMFRAFCRRHCIWDDFSPSVYIVPERRPACLIRRPARRLVECWMEKSVRALIQFERPDQILIPVIVSAVIQPIGWTGLPTPFSRGRG
jgi:hypothetical protein